MLDHHSWKITQITPKVDRPSLALYRKRYQISRVTAIERGKIFARARAFPTRYTDRWLRTRSHSDRRQLFVLIPGRSAQRLSGSNGTTTLQIAQPPFPRHLPSTLTQHLTCSSCRYRTFSNRLHPLDHLMSPLRPSSLPRHPISPVPTPDHHTLPTPPLTPCFARRSGTSCCVWSR